MTRAAHRGPLAQRAGADGPCNVARVRCPCRCSGRRRGTRAATHAPVRPRSGEQLQLVFTPIDRSRDSAVTTHRRIRFVRDGLAALRPPAAGVHRRHRASSAGAALRWRRLWREYRWSRWRRWAHRARNTRAALIPLAAAARPAPQAARARRSEREGREYCACSVPTHGTARSESARPVALSTRAPVTSRVRRVRSGHHTRAHWQARAQARASASRTLAAVRAFRPNGGCQRGARTRHTAQ